MCAHENEQMDSTLFFLLQNYHTAPNFRGNIFMNFVINLEITKILLPKLEVTRWPI